MVCWLGGGGGGGATEGVAPLAFTGLVLHGCVGLGSTQLGDWLHFLSHAPIRLELVLHLHTYLWLAVRTCLCVHKSMLHLTLCSDVHVTGM